MKKFLHRILNLRGKIGRKEFIIYNLVWYIMVVIIFKTLEYFDVNSVYLTTLSIIWLLIFVEFILQRLNDLKLPKSTLILLIVPIINLLVLYKLLFVKGENLTT
jgi:uncharacterized membrane protein YhaH (DUF805 family)